MVISIRNLCLAIADQFPLKKAFRGFFVTGVSWGLFSINSHISHSTGNSKISYSKASARKAAKRMSERHSAPFSYYKCAFCDGYHIGRQRTRIEALNRK